ncbi:MAG TPA: response regulator transcription factor [Gaiellales bacterium]|nr:response regulator transcription factor [Gaiellales bacterium]
MEQLRVVVVDDHPIYRRGLVGVLEAGGVAVAGVADGIEDGLAVVEATAPDAALVDLYLCDGSGVALVRQIAKLGLGVRTVMLTVSHDADDMLAAVRAGADGFLTKDQAPQRLVRALRGVFEGEAALSRSMTGHLVREIRERVERVAPAAHLPQRERLTARQLEILQLIAAGRSTSQIADTLCLSPETVRWHVKSILRKLHAKNRAEAAAVLREIAV